MFKNFESLGKSNIEGIEVLARQFHTVSMNLKRKQYDMLAPRTVEFEMDFAKFMAQISHIEVCIMSFCLQSLLWVTSVVSLSLSIVSSGDGHIKTLAILICRTSCRHL